jgi:hypothetical protein
MPELEPEQDQELDDAFAEFAEESPDEDNADNDDADIETPAEANIEAEAPDELALSKKEIERLNHKYNSDLGRQSALQRKIDEQSQQIQAFQSKSNPEKEKSNGEWDTANEDYPDIMGAVNGRFETLEANHKRELESVRGELQPFHDQAKQQSHDMQMNQLETAHSDWREVVVGDDYKNWLGAQPSSVQAMMSSEDAADNIYLLDGFKSAHPSKAQSVQQRRQRQLQQAQTVSTRGGRANPNVISEDDFEGAFNHYSSKK